VPLSLRSAAAPTALSERHLRPGVAAQLSDENVDEVRGRKGFVDARGAAACRTTRAALAAKALKTDYKTLHLRMKLLGIRARDFGA
jgi:hypothetical protein